MITACGTVLEVAFGGRMMAPVWNTELICIVIFGTSYDRFIKHCLKLIMDYNDIRYNEVYEVVCQI